MRNEKIQILTLLQRAGQSEGLRLNLMYPIIWSERPKKVRETGIMSTPNPKPGRSLPQPTARLVTDFYESDENSRMMPGKKDCVSVRTEKERIMVQKRLVLMNLRELYRFFIGSLKISIQSKRSDSQNCRPLAKTLRSCWCKWYPFSLCVYHSPECQAADTKY